MLFGNGLVEEILALGEPSRPMQCVYTCLLGRYEKLVEQPVALKSKVPFICFTDQDDIRSDTWTIRLVEPVLELDAPRSSRHPKILPNLYLKEFSQSLYIDNSVRLKKDPGEILEFMLKDSSTEAAFIRHSFRDDLWDEYAAVQVASLDTPFTISETLDCILSMAPECLDEPPIWGAFIARRHNQVNVVNAMTKWWTHVLRYSRRDQLTLPGILSSSKLSYIILDLDNHSSVYHEWPIHSSRLRNEYTMYSREYGKTKLLRLLEETLQLRDKVTTLTSELDHCRTGLETKNRQLDKIKQQVLTLVSCLRN